ncbi:unnamed protein product [Phytomonas sp. Hart1]|nr:unnamed protein product [Phytomonas sp. Hart1]|eukprot:CCW69493.1 unnamed protein product [Phytomonas sp. isolate Hart1]
MLQRKHHKLDSLELKALSVSSSLRFLLGVECQVVLCITKMGSRHPFSLYFPRFSETFRKLLSFCASRFQLTCEHLKGDSGSVLKGKAVIPLLRYADYLPGALHVDEILACLSLVPTIRDRHSYNTLSKSDKNGTPGSEALLYELEACFDDYKEFTVDLSLSDVQGRGLYLTLEYGLGMATHSHLVELTFHADQPYQKVLQEFQEFSGWTKFDLRFYDDQFKSEGGIIVMPTVQDACDLLEKYEDEESDDDCDLLMFTLRPVAPLVPVPCVEDSVLCRQRKEHWDDIVDFWERFPKNKNTVVIYNLYGGAMIAEILAFLAHLPIEEATMVEDDSPSRRRRLFVTFLTSHATMQALELDGKSTKGRALRVQVAPPYISKDRRGVVVEGPLTGAALKPEAGNSVETAIPSSGRKRGQTPPTPALSTTPPPAACQEEGKKGEPAASIAKMATPKSYPHPPLHPEPETTPAAPAKGPFVKAPLPPPLEDPGRGKPLSRPPTPDAVQAEVHYSGCNLPLHEREPHRGWLSHREWQRHRDTQWEWEGRV